MSAKETAKNETNPGWVTNQDSNLIRPKDYETLMKEISNLKVMLNESEEDRKLHKANSDKY